MPALSQKTMRVAFLLCLIAGLGVLVIAGCPKPGSQDKPPEVSRSQAAEQSRMLPGSPSEAKEKIRSTEATQPSGAEPGPPQKPQMPRVVMAEVDRALCKLFVGDEIPSMTLPDRDGKATELSHLFGGAGTVVVFFSTGGSQREKLLTSNLLDDLQQDIAEPYAASGVNVVGIHVGDPKESLPEILEDSEARFPILIDRDGAYYAQFASHGPPALYLIDNTGKIVWLDIEYSRATRENLKQAVAAVLAEKP